MVESPTQYKAPVESLDVSPAADRQLIPLESQVSLISSVQLSPNRVRENFAYNTLDVFPVFQVSQEDDGYFPDMSPVTSLDARSIPSSPVALAPGSLLNEVTRLFDSIVRIPVTSLSITDYAVDLSLLSEPLIHLLDELLLLPVPVPMRPQPSPGVQPPFGSIASVVPSPVALSCEGPFNAYCEPGNTGEHLLILTGIPGCPYWMTTYWEEVVAHIDSTFGVQLHHPRFLKCIGAPESARLLCRSPAEWIQVMDCQDVLVAALKLQRDDGLMASNVSVFVTSNVY